MQVLDVERPSVIPVSFLSSAHLRRVPVYIYGSIVSEAAVARDDTSEGEVEEGSADLSLLAGESLFSGAILVAVLADAVPFNPQANDPFHHPQSLLLTRGEESYANNPRTKDFAGRSDSRSTGMHSIATGSTPFPLIARDIRYLQLAEIEDSARLASFVHSSHEFQSLVELWQTNDATFVARVLPAFVHHLPLLKAIRRDAIGGSDWTLTCVTLDAAGVSYPSATDSTGQIFEVELEQTVKTMEMDNRRWMLRREMLKLAVGSKNDAEGEDDIEDGVSDRDRDFDGEIDLQSPGNEFGW
jgi:hypothetical protein